MFHSFAAVQCMRIGFVDIKKKDDFTFGLFYGHIQSSPDQI